MNTQSIVKPVQKDSDLPDYIFYKFDSLTPGNGFIINEENDPHSIYSQMLKEKGDTFSWEYLAVGPKRWCIKISKREQNNADERLGEIALSDYRKAIVLRKFGLDYSFKGKKTLREACADRKLSVKTVQRELEATGHEPLIYTVNYNNWELDYLTDFIITNHHQYTRRALSNIAGELDRYSKIIKSLYPNLNPLVEAFNELNIGMKILMLQEEQVLFPYIRFLVQVTRGKVIGNALPSGSVQDHISKIEGEQSKIGELVEYICNFTNNYRGPHIEHTFYTQILQWLNELDNDLRQHVHIENNILFRKAMLLEQEYLANDAISKSLPGKVYHENSYISSLL